MSKTIDEKVVQLKFDNSNFEKNVSKSMSTLERFQNALKFDGATKGLDDIEKAAKKCDISSLEKGVDSLQMSFKALDVVAVTALQNITNRVVNFGLELARSMSGFDLVKSGWSKMDQMTGSVQTLVNSTGLGVEEISKYLDKLMIFSDETSFGFNDMTSALATMTASGGDIKKLIPMIEGIANATAYAGKGAAEFSRVIYNLNQSYSAGYLQLMDWKSVQLAGVNSKALMQTLIDTAEELGKINKGTVTLANFTDKLKDKWADTEVMEKAFDKFAVMTEAAQEMYEKGEVDNFTDAYEILKEDFDEIAVKAALSAQEAKTFKEAIDSVTDAASSKWLQVFNKMFGNYDQAKKIWTDVSMDLYDLFVQPIDDFANDIISPAFEDKWLDFKDLIEETGMSMESFQENLIEYGNKNGKNISELIEKYGSLRAALSSGEIGKNFIIDFIKSISKGEQAIDSVTSSLSKFQEIYDKVWAGEFGDGDVRFKKLTEAGYDYYQVQGLINDMAKKGHREGYKLTIEDLNDLSDAQLKSIGYTEDTIKAFREMADQIEDANTPLEELIENITRPSGRQLLADSIRNLLGIFVNLQNTAKTAWEEVSGSKKSANLLYNAINTIYKFTKTIRNLTEESNILKNVFKAFYSVLDIVGKGFSFINEIVSQLIEFGLNLLSRIFKDINFDFQNFTDLIGDNLDKLIKWIDENNIIVETLENVSKKIEEAIKWLKEWASAIIDLDKAKDIFNSFKDGLQNFKMADVSKSFKPLKDIISDIKNGNINPLENFVNNIGKYLGAIGETGVNVKNTVLNTLSQIKNPIKISEEELSAITKKLNSFVETLIGLGAGYLVLTGLKKLTDGFANLTKPIMAVSDMLRSFSGMGTAIAGYFNELKNNIRTDNIIKMALAISILAGALYLLAKLDKDALWNAVWATAALAVVIGGLAVAVNYTSGIAGDKASGLENVTKMLLALAASIFIISLALKNIDNLTYGLESMIIAIGLMIAIVKATNKIKVNPTSAWMFIGFAASLYIMALALKRIDSIDFNHFGKTIIALGLCVASLVAISYAVKGVNKGAATSILAISASMYLLAKSFEKFGNIDGETYYKGLLTMVPIIGVMILILKAASKASANIGSAGLFALGIAAAVFLIGKSIEKLGSLEPAVIIKGGTVSIALMGIIGLMAAAFATMAKSFGTMRQVASMALMAIALSATLYLMAGAVMIFKNMDEQGLFKAVKAIALLELAFGAMIFLMRWTNFDWNSFKSLGALAVILAILAGSVLALSFIDSTKLQQTVVSIIAMIGSLTLLMGSVALLKDNKSILMAMVSMLAILGAVSAVLYFLTENITDVDKASIIAEALSNFIVKLSAAMLLISAASFITSLSSGAASGLLTILGVLGIMGSVMVAVGALIDAIPGSLGAMDTAVAFLTKIGEGIGGLIGGLVGSLVGSTMNSFTTYMPLVAESLSLFATNIKDFLELSFPEGFDATIKGLSDMIMTFGKPEFMQSIKEIGKNKKSISDLKEFFSKYGDAVIEFSDKIKGKINVASVQAAADAGLMMAELNNSLPSQGGLWQLITGGKDLKSFSSNMTEYADGLVNLSTKLKDVDLTVVDKAKAAGDTMSALNNSIPAQGGLWQALTGEKSLSTFGASITTFAQGLVDMSGILTDFNPEVVDKAKTAGETLASLANSIPESGSLKTLLFGGEKSLGDFGANIINFASGLASLSTILTSDPGFDESTPEIAVKAGETMASIANAIPESGGWFTSGKDLGSFGKSLKGFAQGLVDFSNIIGQLDLSTFPTGEEIEQYTYILGKDFITNFGEGIGDTTTISSITSSITELMNTIIEKMNKKGEAETVGINILKGLYNGLSNSGWINKLYNQVDTLSNSVTNKMKKNFDIQSPSKVTEEIGKFVGMGLINGLSSMQDKVGTKAENVALLMSESLSSAINLANSILDEDLNPVITPVLDLSNIEGNAGAISDLMSANASLNGALAANPYGQNPFNQNGEKSVNVSVNFTVNNAGRDLSDSDVKRFGRQIANEVNEVLGGMVA